VSEPDLDCGDSGCKYAKRRGGMRTNGGCRCDECPYCGVHLSGIIPRAHRSWCTWLPRLRNIAEKSGYQLVPRIGEQIAPDTAEPAEKQPNSR
jgi:hypothetical protein